MRHQLTMFPPKETLPPVTYQGGKHRLAQKIVDCMSIDENFVEMCCGSGAVSLHAVKSGQLNPAQITMVDLSPWGDFWRKVGEGSFDMDLMGKSLQAVPHEKSDVPDFLANLAGQGQYSVYTFLLLQAGSFGGKAVWWDEGWQNFTPRSYWLPTQDSSRQYAVNPMSPMPSSIYHRLMYVCKYMHGVTGKWRDANSVQTREDDTVYIDPPYDETTGYGFLSYLKVSGNHLIDRGN